MYANSTSLYGLKQGPIVWFKNFHHALVALGFTSTKSEQSLFVNITPRTSTYILVYVDDILLTRNNESFLQQIVTKLNHQFDLKDLGALDHFLVIQTTTTSTGLHLS